ncbi:MAG: MFS transporter [Desulfobacterales bacterium]|nr:MAG: MFS transporter [Desulfobacterales bacterium]
MSRRWSIFIITSAHFFLSQFYRTSNAVIAPQLVLDLSLDTEALGLMSASFFYAFALTQIPLTLFLDKVGARRVMTVLSLVGILGAFVFSWADSLSLGLVGRILLGVGMACNLMGTLKLVSDWFAPLIFATLSGVVFSIGTLGNIVATTPLVLLVEKVGWQRSFQFIAGINIVLTCVLYLIVRDKPEEITSGTAASMGVTSFHQALANLKLLLRQKDYWIISLSTFVRYGVFAAFQALWAGPYLIEVMGYSAVNAGNLIFLMNIGLLVGGPFWGVVSDRLFRNRKWLIITSLIVLSVITFAFSTILPTTRLMVSALLFFGFGFFTGAGLLMIPHIKDLMPNHMAGAAMTGINFFTMIGPAVFLHGLGILMQALYPHASRGPEAFNAAFLLSVSCLVGVAVLYLFTRDTTSESNS